MIKHIGAGLGVLLLVLGAGLSGCSSGPAPAAPADPTRAIPAAAPTLPPSATAAPAPPVYGGAAPTATTEFTDSLLPLTMLPPDRRILADLRHAGLGDEIEDVRYSGADVEVAFHIQAGAADAATRANAKHQVQTLLETMAGVREVPWGRVTFRGRFPEIVNGALTDIVVVTVRYPVARVTGTDWATADVDHIYDSADLQLLQPGFREP